MAIKKTIKNERHQVIHPITEVSAVEGLSEALAQKQDLLNSGVNIKTINGESILGPGNMIIDGGGSTISVDTEMSDTSENPVQNKVITQAISGFITNSVDDLINYYLKSETYNKTEVDSLIAAVNQFSYEVAASLPTASASTMYKIYLIPSSRPETQNVKDEYITIRSGSEGSYTYSWEQIGSTAIDLSDYVTTSALNTALAAYTTTAQLNTLLAAKQDVINDLSTIRSGAAAGATAYQKPSGGIPKTDLNSGVQASLDLADSAVQADPVGSVTPPVTPSDWATAEQVEELEAKVTYLKDKTSFISGGNLFDKTQEFREGYIDTTGKFSSNTNGYLCTYNIPVKKNVWYTIGVIGNASSFSALFLGARSGDNGTPVTFSYIKYGGTETTGKYVDYAYPGPASIKVNEDNPFITFTVRFTASQDGRDYIVLVEGGFDEFPEEYTPYGNYYVPEENISEEYRTSIQTELGKKAEYGTEVSRNLINPAEVQLDKYISISYGSSSIDSPAPRSNTTLKCACSGLIPVTPGETYYLTRGAASVDGSCFTFIQADGSTVTMPLDPDTSNPLPFDDCVNQSRAYKAPSNAKYALICLALTGWTNTDTQIVGYQFEKGASATPYEPYFEPRDIITTEHLPSEIVALPSEVADLQEQIDEIVVEEKTKKFVYATNSYIETDFDQTYNLRNIFLINRGKHQPGGVSECFNFYDTKLVQKSNASVITVDNPADDICPVNFGLVGGYAGANHGYDRFTRLTASSHGKTYADIGSVYSKDGSRYVIVDIEDTDKIIVAGEPTSTYPIWNNIPTANSGTYTHISGGTHTGNIVATASQMAQGKPIEKLDSTVILVDGERITEEGTYMFKDKVVICQNYKIANYASILSILKANAGSYTGHPDYSELPGVDYCVKLSISYIFTDAAHCFVAQSVSYLQEQKLDYFGFMQKASLRDSANTRLYIPKALPVMNGDDLDFRTNPVYNSTTITQTVDITSEYWENPNLPPDRFIVNDDRIAFSGGYLFDYGVGGNRRKDMLGNAFFLYHNSRKIYPHGIDKDGVGETQARGSNYSSVCFRNYFPLGEFNQGGKLLVNSFEYDGKFYIYADFNAVGAYEISIPEKFIGGAVEVFEHSANVSLLTQIASNTILVNVETASPMYGYLVAKIS